MVLLLRERGSLAEPDEPAEPEEPTEPGEPHGPAEPEEWVRHGHEVVTQLTEDGKAEAVAPQELDAALAARVYHLYLPVYFFCRGLARGRRGEGASLVGLSAPQGCGKTTLVNLLVDRFAADGICDPAIISSGDFDGKHRRSPHHDVSGDQVGNIHEAVGRCPCRGSRGSQANSQFSHDPARLSGGPFVDGVRRWGARSR